MKQTWFKKPAWAWLLYQAIDAVMALLATVSLIAFYISLVRNGQSISGELYEMFLYTTCPVF
jgi:hypothetical protein